MIACHGRDRARRCCSIRAAWPAAGCRCRRRVRVVICNTMVRHELASSEYNARRADCEAGVADARADRTVDPRAAGRDAASSSTRTAPRMPERVYRRCRHVDHRECARRGGGRGARAPATSHRVGALMDASHASLRDDFEVSCPELDTMVEIPRTLGRRLRRAHDRRRLRRMRGRARRRGRRGRRRGRRWRAAIEAATGIDPDVWVTTAGSGVGRVVSGLGARNMKEINLFRVSA